MLAFTKGDNHLSADGIDHIEVTFVDLNLLLCRSYVLLTEALLLHFLLIMCVCDYRHECEIFKFDRLIEFDFETLSLFQ